MSIFFEYLYASGIHSASQLNLKILEAYQQDLLKGRSGATVNRMMNPIRALITSGFDFGYLKENFGKRLKYCDEVKTERKIWSPEDRERILEKCPQWARDYLDFLRETGLRPGQAAKLTHKDVNLETWQLKTWTTKGGKRKDYVIPLNAEAIAILRRQPTHQWDKHPNIFKNSRGNPITATCIGKTVRLIRDELGLKGIVTYGLRHTFGTELVNKGGNIVHVGRLMGHASVRTTEIYLHPDEEVLRSTLELQKGEKGVGSL